MVKDVSVKKVNRGQVVKKGGHGGKREGMIYTAEHRRPQRIPGGGFGWVGYGSGELRVKRCR